MDGLVTRVATARSDLGADVADVTVDGAVGDDDVAGIGGVEDPFAGEHEAGRASSVRRTTIRAPSETGLSWQCAVRASGSTASPPWLLVLTAAGAGARSGTPQSCIDPATSSRGLNGLVT